MGGSEDAGTSACERPYQGRLFVIIGKGCGSSGEAFAALASQVPNAVLVGENTVGCPSYGNVDQTFDFPHAGFIVRFGRTKFVLGKRPACEGIGMFPDYWLDEQNPVAAVMEYCSLENRD